MRRLVTVIVAAIVVVLLVLMVKPPADPRANQPLPAEGNRAFDIPGTADRGVLLLHGLTATPWELRTLGDSLGRHNLTVVAPLIAGHGTTAAVLEQTTWHDWYTSANDSLTALAHRTSRVYIVGVSTGADLAVLLAAERQVDGIVLVSPPIRFRDWRAPFASWYAPLIPYADHTQSGNDISHYYEVTPSRSIAQLNEMIDQVKTALPSVQEPALILQSLQDQTIDPGSATYVFDNLGSADKEWKLYGNASHVLLQDPDADRIIFPAIADFIERH
jgi:carboxylesterase